MYNGLPADRTDAGPVERELAQYKVIGLAVGAYGEVSKSVHRLMDMIKKAQSEKALLRRAGKRALEAASESAAQLARARTENERLRGLLNAYRCLDGA